MPPTSLFDYSFVYSDYDHRFGRADNRQYASWNRTRSIQAPPFLARTDTRTSRAAAAIHNAEGNPGDVVINMGNVGTGGNNNTSSNEREREKKGNKDTLFGPSIGVVGTAPAWCSDFPADYGDVSDEKAAEGWESDELTPDVVKEWERRSKDPSEPTTTLQALVNLKRPTIRLSPLASTTTEEHHSTDGHAHQQQHGLEFEFDCDAPQCAITLHVIGVPAHYGEDDQGATKIPSERATAASGKDGKEKDHLLLYEAMVPGGFARKISLNDGAVLELARLEAAEKAHREAIKAANASKEMLNPTSNVPAVAGASSSSTALNAEGAGNGRTRDNKKRFTLFRKKSHHHASNLTQPQQANPGAAPAVASGPALAVVDAESQQAQALTLQQFFANGEIEKARRQKEKEENAGGVKVAICLSARNEDGKAVGGVRNEQVTFLWVMKHGPTPNTLESAGPPTAQEGDTGAEAGPSSSSPDTEDVNAVDNEPEQDKAEVEDTRPWVVKVVKREARIGPHAFQLHEIYGLTAHTAASEPSHPTAPTAPAPSPSHTYPPPPTMEDAPPEHANEENEASGECLLCLSSPREVVLLPCRHLVACRECAVNMVEFGAGGTVSQPAGTEGAAGPAPLVGTTAGDAAGADANAVAAGTGEGTPSTPAGATTPTPTPAAPRRKRKAKGWFCPVCRQPYTSLLRITTAPPPAKSSIVAGETGITPTDEAKRISLASSLEPVSDEHGHGYEHLLERTPATPVRSPAVPPLAHAHAHNERSQAQTGQEVAQRRSSFEAAVVQAGNPASPTVHLGGEGADERV